MTIFHLPLIGLLLILTSSLASADINDIVVFEKKMGQTSEISLPQNKYFEKIEGAMSAVNESVLPSLDSRIDHGAWKLRAVLIGLGVNFEAGLGPIISVAAKSRFQLIYTRDGYPFSP